MRVCWDETSWTMCFIANLVWFHSIEKYVEETFVCRVAWRKTRRRFHLPRLFKFFQSGWERWNWIIEFRSVTSSSSNGDLSGGRGYLFCLCLLCGTGRCHRKFSSERENEKVEEDWPLQTTRPRRRRRADDDHSEKGEEGRARMK